MEIRDPVHGSIHILDEEIPIIRDEFFQRLRNIKQLGFSDYVFPGATHTRFLHSVGVMHIGTIAFDRIFSKFPNDKNKQRLKQTLRLACLLHDIGHAPLSHSTESAMPKLSELKLPKRFLNETDLKNNRMASHEDYTIKSITDSSFTKSFSQIETKFDLDKNCVADLIVGHSTDSSYFTIDGIDFFPIMHQLVSSELDCDRMDYLLRDSYFCGVSYGHFDLDWMLDNLQSCIIDDKSFLGISERAVVTFDDFLLSRFHMFLMVYFHYRSVCLEQLLFKFFKTSPDGYKIPSNIEEYIKHDDHHLMKILRKSTNPYANSVVKNNIPQKIFESTNDEQLHVLETIQRYLESKNIEYIRCSSSGRLSKYYSNDLTKQKYSLKVSRSLYGSKDKIYFDIDEATDLFSKFSKTHAVNRLHCDLNLLSSIQKNEIIELAKNGPLFIST